MGWGFGIYIYIYIYTYRYTQTNILRERRLCDKYCESLRVQLGRKVSGPTGAIKCNYLEAHGT